jgi:thioredoxin 1
MEITGIELEEKIKNGEKLIVDLYGTWCGPCKVMKPIFERVAAENSTDVQMYTMDVDMNRDVAVKYGVRSIPTILSFKNGTMTESKVGALNESTIKGLITNVLNG